jgi:hypothetical protein
MDARGFSRELKRFVNEDVKKRALKKYKQIVLDLGSSVIRDTPVDTGLARASWHFTTSRVSAAFDERKRDSTGSAALGRLQGVVSRLVLNQPVYMANNAPYIERLEYGWSQQAPNGMLAKNIARVRSKYKVL